MKDDDEDEDKDKDVAPPSNFDSGRGVPGRDGVGVRASGVTKALAVAERTVGGNMAKDGSSTDGSMAVAAPVLLLLLLLLLPLLLL